MNEVKLCKDCEWFYIRYTLENDGATPLCRDPKSCAVDLILGGFVPRTCEYQRIHASDGCGREAKYFEPKGKGVK